MATVAALSLHAPEVRAYLEAVEADAERPYVALLGLKGYDAVSAHRRVKEGATYTAFERFRRVVDFPALEVAALVGIPARTLARRKEVGRLSSEETDRLMRLARLVGKAIELFEGDVRAARGWLESPQRALGGLRPLELADTEPGVAAVETLIGRLEHGIVV